MGLAMIEMDGNDPVVANTGSSSKVENDLVGSRKRKRPEHDRAEIQNEENDFVVSVMDTGNGAKQTQGIGPRDEEVAACRRVNASFSCGCIILYMFVMPISLPIFFSLLVDSLRL